jgi:hypothetical protein
MTNRNDRAIGAAWRATPCATLIETVHPDVTMAFPIPMVHRVYAIDGPDQLVELPANDGTDETWTYRVTTVRTITQRDPQAFSRSRTRATWVNLVRQTKTGRDFARGGFASVELSRLIAEINPGVGGRIREALMRHARPVAVHQQRLRDGEQVEVDGRRCVVVGNALVERDDASRVTVAVTFREVSTGRAFAQVGGANMVVRRFEW